MSSPEEWAEIELNSTSTQSSWKAIECNDGERPATFSKGKNCWFALGGATWSRTLRFNELLPLVHLRFIYLTLFHRRDFCWIYGAKLCVLAREVALHWRFTFLMGFLFAPENSSIHDWLFPKLGFLISFCQPDLKKINFFLFWLNCFF